MSNLLHLNSPTQTLTMSSREIAELTGKDHRNVMRDIRAMLVELHGSEDCLLKFEQTEERPSPLGNGAIKSVVFKLPKRECLILVSGYSITFRARIIDRWQELEANSVTQKRDTVTKASPTVEALEVAEVLARFLNVEGSGRLGMARTALKLTGAEHLEPLIPAYAIDAPKDSTTGSSAPTAALRTLLAKHNIHVSVQKANSLLIEAGLLEEKERPSTSVEGATRTFKCITEKGLKYGKNVTSDKNPRETQPHWYEEKFVALGVAAGFIPVF